MIEIRPYQSAAIQEFKKSPLRRKLVVLSTGMGKTITGLALANDMGVRCLWLAHREELITQPIKSLRMINPAASYGVVKADRNEYMRDFVFASIQSAQQERRAAQLAAQRFGLVVVDEAHHALSPGYISLLATLGCMGEDGPQLLGLTATPERSDSGALDQVFQGIVYQVGITSAIEGGYLVPPRVIERSIKIDLDAVSTNRGDYGMKQLDIALMQAGIVQEICAAYHEHCHGKRKTIIFVVSVAQAEAVASELAARGVRAASVSGETSPEERKRTLRRLTSGEIECIVNCMVLTEGFDEPSIDAVILARPTQSKPLMIQCVGRGLRLFPNKTDCLVIDMVGASKRNTLVQAAVLFGIRPDPEEEKRIIAGNLDPISDPEEYWRQRFRAQINGVKGAPRSKLRWIRTSDNVGWLLAAGEYGTIRMMPGMSDDEWIVDVVGVREGPARQSLSDVPVSLETAQAIAEDYVRRVKVVTMARGDASWRDNGLTEAQEKILHRAKIKTDGMTRGTASDLITQIQTTKAVEPATAKQISALRRMGVKVTEGLTKREAMRAFAGAKNR